MQNEIFRQKSLDRISSPESLDEYLKVASPSIWLTLVAVILLLVGVCFWGIFGSMESSESVPVVSDGNNTYCYIDEDFHTAASQSHKIRVDGQVYKLGDIPGVPEELTRDNEEDAYVLHLMGTDSDDMWVYKVRIETPLPAGSYSGWVISKQIHPIKYVMQ